MFKKWKLAVALLAMVGMLAAFGTGCGDDDDSGDVKAAFIYVGPPGDAGGHMHTTKAEAVLKKQPVQRQRMLNQYLKELLTSPTTQEISLTKATTSLSGPRSVIWTLWKL